MQRQNSEFFDRITKKYATEIFLWKDAVQKAQEQVLEMEKTMGNSSSSELCIKDVALVFYNHPAPQTKIKIEKDLWHLVSVKGYVFRISTPIKRVVFKQAKCNKCRKTTLVHSDRNYNYSFNENERCSLTKACTGKLAIAATKGEEPNLDHTIDFQEMKLQLKQESQFESNNVSVQLEDHLIDKCKISDTVRVCGIVETRLNRKTKNLDKIVLRGVSVLKEDYGPSFLSNPSQSQLFLSFWHDDMTRLNYNELAIRDEMLQAVAPRMSHAGLLKLALLLTLCTGGNSQEPGISTQLSRSSKKRDVSHLLFIGDPALGKLFS
jgi:DNA replicative helicase MCM subunit Mcm2 (Cdc46/Mcm family)